jgi:predicted membrane protein
MKSKIINNTLVKFLAVGVVNTLIGAGIMFLLYNVANCSYWLSSAANYVVGGIVSFLLNKYFTFENKGWSWGQVWRFALNVAVCYFIGYGLAKPAVLWVMKDQAVKIQENIAMAVGMCLYTGLNYLGQRFFAFKAVKTEKTSNR